MKVAVYSSHRFEEDYLKAANINKHELLFIREALIPATAKLAKDAKAVCAFVSDDLGQESLRALSSQGVKFLALRSAGYNHLDVFTAKKLGMQAARVPAYSPNAIAEHAVALMMALNRKIVRANTLTHQLNFSLDGLVGFDMKGKTVGIIGAGKIGSVMAAILHGFGCRMVAYDKIENKDLCRLYGLRYVSLPELYRASDIISLHVPLNLDTEQMINKKSIAQMKRGVMLINTGRGKLIDTPDVIATLKTGQIGAFGMDVYADESLFFADHSGEILKDDVLARLMSFENVIITGHQAFLTKEALSNIANVTLHNLDCFENGQAGDNLIL